MKKVKCIIAKKMMTLFLFAFAFLSTSVGLQQVSAQNTNTNELVDYTSDIVSNNGTLNLSSNILSIHHETVTYDNYQGYLSYPSTNVNNTTTSSPSINNKLPAVIMIHEWWGLNDNIKNMANELSKEGYVVLAVDLYNGEVATTSDKAMQLVGTIRENPQKGIDNLQAAVRYLSSLENVDSSRIASLGWCFGGGQSLQLALNSEQHPLAATILYYGTPLVTDKQELSKIKWPVQGIFGDKDQAIPIDSVRQFEQSLNELGITNEIYVYPGVGHAFANPTGDNFALKETQDAWQKTLAFLDKYIG